MSNKIVFKCRQCAKCCSNLAIDERIRISLALKTIMLRKKCRFLNNNTCSVYGKRAKLCREWECGASK